MFNTTYFAHSILDYGTELEQRAMRKLWSHPRIYGRIINPNHPQHDAAYKAYGWGYFMGLIADIDICVFMRAPSGAVSSGVAAEMKSFLDRNLEVWEIDRETLELREIGEMPGPVQTIEETRAEIKATREQQAAAA